MNVLLPAAAMLAALSLTSTAPPDAVSPARRPGGLLIAEGGLGGVLEVLRHDVRVVVNNGIAVTTVDQVFHNTEPRIVEALYTFPVPKDAMEHYVSLGLTETAAALQKLPGVTNACGTEDNQVAQGVGEELLPTSRIPSKRGTARCWKARQRATRLTTKT
jgi:hypothetical protein